MNDVLEPAAGVTAAPVTKDTASAPWAKGVLCVLETHGWTGRITIPAGTLKRLAEQEGANPKWLKGGKDLVDPSALADLVTARGEARTFLYSNALPFPIKGIVFIPYDLVERVDKQMRYYSGRIEGAAQRLYNEFESHKFNARQQLGPLYNESDYPSDVRTLFGLSWTWMNIAAPDGAMAGFAPLAYADAQRRFNETIEDARKVAIEALRFEFNDMLGKMTERLSGGDGGKPKVFRDTLVTNFTEYFETFKARNVWDDKALADLVDKAKAVLNGVSPDTLRTSAFTKERVRAEVAKIGDALTAAMVDAPTRAFSFDDKE